MPTVRRFRGQQRRPQIDTAAAYERAWGKSRWFDPGGKTLTREQFHRERFEAGELRELYESSRAEFAALAPPGERHHLWWLYDAPAPRDEAMAEAEQLFHLGELSADEIELLRVEAVEHDRQLHATPWHIGLPFRRPWTFWRFVAPEPRDPSSFESAQLASMDVLTSLEKQILAEPDRATGMKGTPICRNRTRFYYIGPTERESLGLSKGHSNKIDAMLLQ